MVTGDYYRLTKDAIKDVGITIRQLNYWRDHGLVKNERKDPRTFTPSDLAWLRLVKLLIVDYGLSPKAAQKVLQRVEREGWLTEDGLPRTLLDLPTGALLSSREVARRYLTGALWDEDLDELEKLLLALSVAWLTKMRSQTPNVAVYQARRDAFISEIRQLELASRVEHRIRYLDQDELDELAELKQRQPKNPEEDWELAPWLPEDDDLSRIQDPDGNAYFRKNDFATLREKLLALLKPLGLPVPPAKVTGTRQTASSADFDEDDIPF